MTINVVRLEHPSGASINIKSGFSWPAFFLGPLWALTKRMWLLLFLLTLALLPLFALDAYAEYKKSVPLSFLVLVLLNGIMFICGRYGNRWLYAKLLKQGYKPVNHGAP